MTKRKWRRLRGQLISRNPHMKPLRNLRYTKHIVCQVLYAFMPDKYRPRYDEFHVKEAVEFFMDYSGVG